MIRLLTVLLVSWFCALSAWAGININQAGASELESLPGIGPAKAAAIVAYRADHGTFKNLTDLDQVPGIGPATLANIGPLVVFAADGEAAPAAQPATKTIKTSHTPAPAADGINGEGAEAQRA